MKNLLKSVMLMLLIVPFIGCESESIDTLNQNQSELNRDNSLSNAGEPCGDMQTFTKFVNYGSYETDFMAYDAEGVVLTSEVLAPGQTSDLKSITSNGKVSVVIRNSEYVFRKVIKMKTCLLHTFIIDESNTFSMYKSEL